MSCLGFKGGIGTASRVVSSGHAVGVLVLTNFGDQQRLTIDGVPVGRLLPPAEETAGRRLATRPPAGSCITVIVTDAPLDATACSRLARRAGLGLARTGSTAHHGSGEIFLALATGLRAPRGGAAPADVTAHHWLRARPVLRRGRGGDRGSRADQPAGGPDRHRPGRQHLAWPARREGARAAGGGRPDHGGLSRIGLAVRGAVAAPKLSCSARPPGRRLIVNRVRFVSLTSSLIDLPRRRCVLASRNLNNGSDGNAATGHWLS